MPIDILLTVPYYPESGAKIDATAFCLQGGGPVPNALVGLSRLGCRTAIIAAVGNDSMAQVHLDELKKEKVDARYLVHKKTASDTASGMIEIGTGRRTIALYRRTSIRPSDLKPLTYPRPRLVHLDGRDLDACIKLARWAKRAGALVSFDIGSVRNDVSPIFPLVDHLVVADAYAFSFTGETEVRKAIGELRRHCAGTIVITEGLRGSTGLEQDEWVYQPAYRVSAVDTTGAGDAFHAGYLYGLLRGDRLAERLKLGAAVAALKCTGPGARTSLPSRAKLRAFLKNLPEAYA